MSNLMARLTADYILKRGSTVSLNDGTVVRCGFQDTGTKVRSGETLDGYGAPDKTESVKITLAPDVPVMPADILTYGGTRYRVDRVILHGDGDNAYTQTVVAEPA